MTPTQPTAFVSHGSPMLVLEDGAAHRFLKGFGDIMPEPRAILAVSAHWETDRPVLSRAAKPDTIHDFGGFPRELFEMRYPAPGAPDVAETAARLLAEAGFDPELSPDRGLDHGAWVPLKLAYPDADVPVTQLSIQPRRDPEWHFRLGRALRPLRDEGVLILGSGAVTHNLEAFFRGGFEHDSSVPDWVNAFSRWLAAAIEEGRLDDLLAYRERAPFGAENHPTPDHILPLFVALGAAGDSLAAKRVHDSFTYGILAMDAYVMQ